jgi:two-component system CheB/CheR fusion protein
MKKNAASKISARTGGENGLHFQAKLLDIIDQSVIATDLDGVVRYWNKGAETLYGWTAEEAVGRSILALTTPEIMVRQAADIMAQLRAGKSWKGEFTVRRRDGATFPAQVSNTPVIDAEGRLTGVVGVTIDISRYLMADEAKLFLAAIVESSEDSIISINLEGVITSWNKAAERLYGYPAAEAVGKPLAMLLLPEDLKKTLSNAEKIKRGETVKIFDMIRVHKDNHPLNLEIVLSPVKDGDGRVIGISTVARDITERKVVEEAFSESKERLRLLIESATDYAIFTVTKNNIVNSWNTGAENTFGWTEDEIIGKSGELLFTEEDRARGIPQMEMECALKTGKAEDERWHARRDGSHFYASGVMQPLRDGRGFVKICRDQTEKLKAETVLHDKEMLKQMVSTQEDERRRIARDIHDHFGQRMTTLRLKLESVKAMCDDQTICDEIDELDEIAAQLDREIDFIAWELRPASLDDLGLRIALAQFVKEWSLFTGIKAEFHTNGLGRPRPGYEIETNLYRIAQEALNNIYKHAKPKSVSVLLEKRKNIISLIVEDDGVGFNPAAKANRTKGMGLVGMSERAKICGGAFEIESQKGKGTTVYAKVPLKVRTEN